LARTCRPDLPWSAAFLLSGFATVRRFIQAGSFPERARRRIPRRTDAVQEFLQRRWEQGCRNAARLFDELKASGFEGSYYMVRRRIAPWRRNEANEATAKELGPASRLHFSPRQMVRLLLKPELNDAERSLRQHLEAHDLTLKTAASLGRQLREMVRQRRAEDWQDWLRQVQHEATPAELRTFAKGLQDDEAAVRAALSSPWSNGQVEGQVNRLKALKRQMYGRANFDLLRQRFLLSA
jgi:transposase